jgi:hypothetical protein
MKSKYTQKQLLAFIRGEWPVGGVDAHARSLAKELLKTQAILIDIRAKVMNL